jgi:hypothetical protein
MILLQQPTNAADLLTGSGTYVATEAMQSIFGMDPHAWQEQVIMTCVPHCCSSGLREVVYWQ